MTLSDLNSLWPVMLGLFLICAVSMWFYLSKVRFARAETIPVQRKSRMLSVAERNLLDCLADALSDKYFIFAKVGMNEVIEPSSGAKLFDTKYLNEEIDGNYFDFVLCNISDMSIFGIVELEYSERSASQRKSSAKRKRRDALIDRLCKSANLKLFYFDVRQDYKNMDIARLITGKSKQPAIDERASPTHQSQLTIDNSSHSVIGNIRSCPKCRSEVVTKVAVKGSNIGEKFLMCRKYPYCDYRISMKDLESMRELEQDEVRKSKSEGFKNWSAG